MKKAIEALDFQRENRTKGISVANLERLEQPWKKLQADDFPNKCAFSFPQDFLTEKYREP